jgi:hypothetical protein
VRSSRRRLAARIAVVTTILVVAVSCSPEHGDHTQAPNSEPLRVQVYEAMIRKLYNPQGTQPVYTRPLVSPRVVPSAGIEPATPGLGNRCSIH